MNETLPKKSQYTTCVWWYAPTDTARRIKKAYRRKALELHPDRNHGNEEDATRLFTEIQAAYEVLIDTQERSWYDSHEGAILRGYEPGQEDAKNFGYNIKLTTSDDISRVIGAFHGRKIDYDDVPAKFFTELGPLFETLASEESTASKMEGMADPEYPPFGVREDEYETVVKSFYAAWGGFSTSKSYFWEDKYNLTEAEDRRVRRLMEKENKKLREDAVREFNDTVRMLVAFVRKRDPRYKPNFQTEAERQKALRDASAAQAARSRAAHQAKINTEIPEWAKAQAADDLLESDEEEVVTDIFECVACRKTFKSEKQVEAHERSKKHQQLVKNLIRKMKKENDALNLDSDGGIDTHTTVKEEEEDDDDGDIENDAKEDEDNSKTMEHLDLATDSDDPEGERADATKDEESRPTTASDTDDDDESASKSKLLSTLDAVRQEGNEDEMEKEDQQPKMGKAAQKRAKRAAAQRVESKDEENQFTCVKCNTGFSNRSKLFEHIKKLPSHAAPVGQPKAGGEKKKKGKR